MKKIIEPLDRAYRWILEENEKNETRSKNLALANINEALHEIEKTDVEEPRQLMREALLVISKLRQVTGHLNHKLPGGELTVKIVGEKITEHLKIS